jgi:hypothetical protein
MHPSTEDLLSVRDGQPVDARTSEAIAADARCLNEVERLRRARGALRNLPELEAPAGSWERIVAAERDTRYRSASWVHRAVGGGIAAAVAIAAIGYLTSPRDPPAADGASATASTAQLPRFEQPSFDAPRSAPLVGRVVPVSYTALVAESARLERLLGQISYQRPLMNGATASTIAGLEDRIGVIDEQLTYSTARRLPQPQRAALWGERVELMNALVQVRYAQAQPTGF